MYKLVITPTGPSDIIFRVKDSVWIPPDPANTDYQQYLAWLAEGNEPLPADEPPAAE
jgi:hypothetical protein